MIIVMISDEDMLKFQLHAIYGNWDYRGEGVLPSTNYVCKKSSAYEGLNVFYDWIKIVLNCNVKILYDNSLFSILYDRSSHRRCSMKKGVLENFAKFIGKHLYQSLFFKSCRPQPCNFIKKGTLAKVFSCKFCEIFKNTFFTETSGRLLPNLCCFTLWFDYFFFFCQVNPIPWDWFIWD